MPQARILIVEDSAEVANFVQRGLSEEGYQVSVALTGQIGLRMLSESWDLLILDLMLPDMAGESILRYLGQQLESPRVLVLSARGEVADKIALFEYGCDDYLTKPFAFEELLGRVRALLRRSPRAAPDRLQYEDLSLDPANHRLLRSDSDVTLTPKEYAICRLLISRPGEVVSRRELLRSVWGLANEQRTNFVEVHLANLRKKLAQLDCADWLQTVRASGITFSRPESHGS